MRWSDLAPMPPGANWCRAFSTVLPLDHRSLKTCYINQT